MNFKLYLALLFVFALASCSPAGQEKYKAGPAEAHNPGELDDDQASIKFQYTSYGDEFELFAEADAFVVGENSNVLSHFSILPSFKAVEKGIITLTLSVNGQETGQTLEEPTRKGIYSFNLQPVSSGMGELIFDISNDKGSYVVIVPEVLVFANEKDANEAYEINNVSSTNTTVFTKEQSWKTEFATAQPSSEPFGQVIRTTALVESAPGSEVELSAKTDGIVMFNFGQLPEGKEISSGQALLTVSGSNFADNSLTVKYAGARSNYEKAQADYERSTALADEKIISEKELLAARNQYENAKAVYENLSSNFNPSGQTLRSPQAGYIKQVFVSNGSYVVSGQPIALVSQDKSLNLRAEVPSRYVPLLSTISGANIRNIPLNQTYTLDELNGRVLSYGKAANGDNFLVPVVLQIENNGTFVPGSFVELYLILSSGRETVSVPNEALLEEQGNFFVWVQVNPELFEKREVFIGGTDGISTEIKKGITAKDRIVTRGAMLIKLSQSTGDLDAHSGHVH